MFDVTNFLLAIYSAILIGILGFILRYRGQNRLQFRVILAEIGFVALLIALQFDPLLFGDIVTNTGLLITLTYAVHICIGIFLFEDFALVTFEHTRVKRFFIQFSLGISLILMAIWILRPSVSTDLTSLDLLSLLYFLGFIAGNGLLLNQLRLSLHQSDMPENRNRLWYWILILLASMISFGFFVLSLIAPNTLAILRLPTLMLIMILIVSQIYANQFYRVISIQSTLTTVIELALTTLVMWIIVFVALLLMTQNNIYSSDNVLLIISGIASVVAITFIPIRQFLHFGFTVLERRKQVQLAKVMEDYSHHIATAGSLDEVVEAMQKTLQSGFGIERSALILINTTRNAENTVGLMLLGIEYEPKPHIMQPPYHLELNGSIFRTLAVKKVPLGTYDIAYSPMYESANESERQFLCDLDMGVYVPVIAENTLLGIMACGAKPNQQSYSRYDVELLSVIGQQIGAALRSARLIDDLQILNASMGRLNQRLQDAKDELEKLDSVKTDFITIASHELRTPLAQLRGYTDIIDSLNQQNMLKPNQTEQFVNNLRKSTERMEELISAMLDVSQIDVNSMDLRFVQTRIGTILRLAIDPLEEVIGQRNLTIHRNEADELPKVQADMQRMVQAFRNIIVNAIKYTPDGGEIFIDAFHLPSNEVDELDWLEIRIRDTGVGIHAKDIELIFNKFYRAFDPQLHSTGLYKFMGAGPGLGLTIAKGIIEGHGGKIHAESPGHNMETMPGATFVIRIPTNPPEGIRRVLPFESEPIPNN